MYNTDLMEKVKSYEQDLHGVLDQQFRYRLLGESVTQLSKVKAKRSEEQTLMFSNGALKQEVVED